MALVDSAALDTRPQLGPVPEARCSTLTPASARTLHSAGAWEAVLASGRAAEFEAMQVWDGGRGGSVRYSASEAGLPLLGHVVENSLLSSSLAQRLGGDEQLTVYAPDELEELRFPGGDVPLSEPPGDAGPDWAAARLRRAGWLRARLVVAADGARSTTRRLAGVRSVGWHYSQRAVVATVACEPHRTAWQRFLVSGPLALLPLGGGYSSVVWSTSASHAQQLLALDEAAFAAQVDEALQRRGDAALPWGLSPPLSSAGPAWQPPPRVSAAPGAPRRASFALSLQHGAVYSRPRLALVGDAAHSFHPLAGQGLNLGLSDAATLAQQLAAAVGAGQDVGAQLALAEYGRRAVAANLPLMASLDLLQRLFASQLPPLQLARSLGLEMVNQVPALRRAIVRYATGEEEPPPTLRGEVQTTAV